MKKRILIILTAGAVLISLSAAGIYWMTHRNNQEPTTEQNQETETKTDKEIALEKQIEEIKNADISDWPVYTNEKYEFQMKYPKGWYAEEKTIKVTENPGVWDKDKREQVGATYTDADRIWFRKYQAGDKWQGKEINKGNLPPDYEAYSLTIRFADEDIYQDERIEFEKFSNQTLTYEKEGGDIRLYLINDNSQISLDPGADQYYTARLNVRDYIMPVARAFYFDSKYYCEFSIQQEAGNQAQNIEYLKRSLESFEFLD